MKIYLIDNNYRYAAEQMLLTMFPEERPEYPEGKPEGDRAELALSEGREYFSSVCRLYLNGQRFIGKSRIQKKAITDKLTGERYLQRIVKLAFYRAALASGVDKPVWGALTGIRPGKLMSNLLEAGLSDRAAVSRFIGNYYVSPERARLCLHTAHAGLACAKSLEKCDICLYVGIPFCPTRCAYCSFVSQSVQKSMKLIPEYLDALYNEIDATSAVVNDFSLRPVSVYIGGGTPTTLSARQLDELCERLETAFDLSAVREYTVEAGRPDTITAEKLEALKRHGVTRVSVNPQTMDDAVLEAIGRKHSAQDVVDALETVRRVGGFEVNMDLIAGLPKDTPDSFKMTLDTVLALGPENITVHTLALKKGSEIMLADKPRPYACDVRRMVDYAAYKLYSSEYEPYYLYRQKYMSGGFENVGWQRGNTESIYNICIMEELCSIISMGGGASTKLCLGSGRIERIFNPKYPAEYIASLDKIMSGRERIRALLSGEGSSLPEADTTQEDQYMAFDLNEINRRAKDDPERFIRECDAEYDAKVRHAADMIIKNRERSPIVLMSGPSGSGKTTTAKKIEEELQKRGINTRALSMDSYFRTVCESSPRTEEGNLDLEAFGCLDAELFTEHLIHLSKGETVEVPKYIFSEQRRADIPSVTIKLGKDDIVVAEGIHALNDKITRAQPDALKLYISARSNIENNGAVCFKGTWMRLVRRVVRDSLFRGASPEYTLGLWANVRRGEKHNISPFKDKADWKFDSSFPYEVCVLKTAAQKLFADVPGNIDRCVELSSIAPALELFEAINPKLLLPDSLLTEFLGGGKYKY